METKPILHFIYPDLTNEIVDNVKKKLTDKYGITIHYLIDDGVSFTLPEELEASDFPGDMSFYNVKDKALILTFTEEFGELVFTDAFDNIILTIPTLDPNDL